MRSESPDSDGHAIHTTDCPHTCGACQSRDLLRVAKLPIYIRDGTIPDSIWRCTDCGSYQRAISFRKITALGHFDVASYTNPAAEERLRTSRHHFFLNLIQILERSHGTPLAGQRCLDIGCSYGHMLDLLRERGAETTGLEIVDRLRPLAAAKGHTLLSTLPDPHDGKRFDIIIMIDSLYLIDDPLAYLIRLRTLLSDDGRFIFRVTHRAPLFDLIRFLRQPLTDRFIGDCKHHFSYRGLRQLLAKAGYCVERVILREKGKRHRDWPSRIYYALTPPLSRLTGCKLTPGLIILARLSSSHGR
jgi:SAM-dependent methyltransferase